MDYCNAGVRVEDYSCSSLALRSFFEMLKKMLQTKSSLR